MAIVPMGLCHLNQPCRNSSLRSNISRRYEPLTGSMLGPRLRLAIRSPPLHSYILAIADWYAHRRRGYDHKDEPATGAASDQIPY